ncbi:flagellar hook-length control protein FliK [Pseudoalteromonas gelatinilytica]|uniref:Flagellar hook-length control protein FliK n=1 Tax=Pseudoalteromonas gelatinilytica TaxID=1703256 RepID=A0A3A3F234_9GAMM|nr:flagellar hook-length control protein FliK [Pseudoalteromonas profundi]RJF34589.1 flagellar hook-length control protein FliK [Pseudoalteromonas profundi]
MAISDINLQVKTEQGTGFSGKDIESKDKASGLSFLTSLTEASEAANAHASTQSRSDNAKTEAQFSDKNADDSTDSAANSDVVSATAPTEPHNNATPETVKEVMTKEQSDELELVEGEDNSLLSQISASQIINTSVNKLTENNELSSVSVDKKPAPIDSNLPVISSPMAENDDSQSLAGSDNSIASLIHKSKVATAVDSQLKAMGDLPPKDSVAPIVDSPLTDKEKQGISAVNTPDTKPQLANIANVAGGTKTVSAELDASKELGAQKLDLSDAGKIVLAKSDPALGTDTEIKGVTDKSIVSLFAKVQSGDGQAVSEFAKGLSLTSEQQKQLEQQINQLKADNTLGADEVATIKSLLTDAMSGKPTVQTTQSPVSQLAVEQDIAEESQAKQDTKLADNKALDNKLPTGVEKQITALTKDEQQALLNKVNAQLQTLTPGTAQYEKLSAAQTVLTEAINTPATTSTAMPVSGVTVNAENNKVKQSNTAQVSEAIAGEEVTAEQEVKLNSERTQETVTPRVAQLFNQLTTPLNTSAQTGAYEVAHQQYEQALDVQTMHTQTTAQTQAQSKSLSVDPGVMQAINIIKSDAAKMLQERVSALLNINNKEAEIRLDPPEMGSMQIRIRSDAEQAQINFVVQNQQAKEALEQSMPRLREMLAQQGIELGESSIQQGSPEQQDGQSEQGQFAGNQQTDEQQPEVSAQSSETSRQQSSSSIDYYA